MAGHLADQRPQRLYLDRRHRVDLGSHRDHRDHRDHRVRQDRRVHDPVLLSYR